MSAGRLNDVVALERPERTADGTGGFVTEWVELFRAYAEIIYQRGQEAVEAGSLTGTASYKIRLRSDEFSRQVTPEFRLFDVHRGILMNVREADKISDRQWVWLVVESGVAAV